jgi:hypothetical protein
MAAISHVFTIARVAEMLGEDEEWLFELSINMFPEDGCLHILGTNDEETTGFTDFGIECLKQIIEDEKAHRPDLIPKRFPKF